MKEPSELKTDILTETENYMVWQAEEPDGEMGYHLELNNVTVHFFEEEWQEFKAMMAEMIKSGEYIQWVDGGATIFNLELDNLTVFFNESEWREVLQLVRSLLK
jgi:hypothetical protein